jgi:Uma2 family endonuclease
MSIRHVFTVAEWRELAETDAFGERARMELLDGEVFDMSPTGSPHAACVSRLNHLLLPQLIGKAIVGIERPVELDDLSMPVPDLVVLRYRPDFYDTAHPVPEDILLVVEVSDSSLAHDRGQKAAAYARTGVLEYWIVDLDGQQMLVLREPRPDGYRTVEPFVRGQTIHIAALPGIEVRVTDVLRPLITEG